MNAIFNEFIKFNNMTNKKTKTKQTYNRKEKYK